MNAARLLLLAAFFAFVAVGEAQQKSLKWWTAQVNKWFRKEKIVPQLLPEAPRWFATVDFGRGNFVNLGNVLTQQDAAEEPQDVHWWSAPGEWYTLAVFDPDAPQNGPFRHFLVINIPGKHWRTRSVAQRPRHLLPPQSNGDDRYVWVVYKQLQRLGNVKEREDLDDRYGWNVTDFARRYDLGKPHAGNFFYVKS
ncbi:Phosphatidylethanolamine-binding proteinF40A3.3-like [Aphelenchoides fujianensis]|nr:Phosphatidylethanolamine-binding proteinF40A3.3-like [Aphelenchoides fujianensis]